jgi:hypothetical protein
VANTRNTEDFYELVRFNSTCTKHSNNTAKANYKRLWSLDNRRLGMNRKKIDLVFEAQIKIINLFSADELSAFSSGSLELVQSALFLTIGRRFLSTTAS